MNRLKDMIQGGPVHERRLDIRTYPVSGDRLIVEGWLRDERLVDGYHWNGQARSAGPVHGMCVRLLIGGWPVTILDAEAEMPTIPHEDCPTTLESVQKVVGLSIVHGYTDEVRHRLGGIQGCNHLTHLIVVMGTAALHGYWTQYSRNPHPVPRSMDEFQALSTLVNSCRLWSEDGPLLRKIQKQLQGPEQPTDPAPSLMK